MSESQQRKVNVQKFINAIETYLKGEDLEKFHQIISNISENQNDPDSIYDQIHELIQDNEKLCMIFDDAVESVSEDLYDAVSAFSMLVQTAITNLKNQENTIPLFTRVISLFVNRLVPLQYLENRLHKLTSTLSMKIRKPIEHALSKFVLKLRTSNEEVFYRTVREDILRNVNKDYVIEPKYKPSFLTQMIISIGCSCNPEQINTIIKALNLYSIDLIPIDGVYQWVQPIDLIIAQLFEDAAQKEPIENFYPATIFENLKKDFNQSQLKWALGNTLYNVLSSLPTEKPPSLIQMALKYKDEYRKLKDRNESATAPYIAEMQCSQMYRIIKIIADHLISDLYNSPPNIPQSLLDSVFGSTQFEPNDAYYTVLINKCIDIGSTSNKRQELFLQHKLSSYDPSSNDWRCTFKYTIEKKYMIHTMFFNGKSYKIKNEETLKIASEIATSFCSRFSDLSDACEKLLRLFHDEGEHELDEYAANSCYCFIELLNMIDEAQSSMNPPNFEKIGEMVWEETSPLVKFDGLSLANVDLVLKYFAKHLHNAYKRPNQFDDESDYFAETSIAFHFVSSENNYELNGYINPVYDLDI